MWNKSMVHTWFVDEAAQFDILDRDDLYLAKLLHPDLRPINVIRHMDKASEYDYYKTLKEAKEACWNFWLSFSGETFRREMYKEYAYYTNADVS